MTELVTGSKGKACGMSFLAIKVQTDSLVLVTIVIQCSCFVQEVFH